MKTEIKKHRIMLMTAIALASLTSTSVYAQSGTRGGGRALVCRNAAGAITSARMLDILEGLAALPIGYGLSIQETKDQAKSQGERDGVVDQLLNQSISKLNGLPELKAKVSQSVYQIKAERIIEDVDSDLIAPEDIGNTHLVKKPKGCHFEPVGVYFEDKKLHVNPEIYQAMDSTNQAAFFLHEGVYAYLRTPVAKEVTSELSRQLVAISLSDLKTIPCTAWKFVSIERALEGPAPHIPTAIETKTFAWTVPANANHPAVDFTFLANRSSFDGNYDAVTNDSLDQYCPYNPNSREQLFVANSVTKGDTTKILFLEATCNYGDHSCVINDSFYEFSYFTKITWDPSQPALPVVEDSKLGTVFTVHQVQK